VYGRTFFRYAQSTIKSAIGFTELQGAMVPDEKIIIKLSENIEKFSRLVP